MRQVERQNHGQSPGQHHGHAYGRVQAHGIHPVQHPHPQHRTAARSDYTLGHGGRQFRLGPVTFWIVVGATVIMAGWSLATGTYYIQVTAAPAATSVEQQIYQVSSSVSVTGPNGAITVEIGRAHV